VAGRDVLLLDDILDSGNTLAAIHNKLETAKPRTMRSCVLLKKKSGAPPPPMPIISDSRSKTNLSSATPSILGSAIAICPASVYYEKS
jgi:hypoxanthine phosphoribosyltransferase